MIIPLIAAALITAVPVNAPQTVPNKWQDSGFVWTGQSTKVRDLAACIRQHESKHNYKAHNAHSSAAGAYQFLDSTWQGNAKWAKYRGEYIARTYKAANHAPPYVQDIVFLHSIKHGGRDNWVGTNCAPDL